MTADPVKRAYSLDEIQARLTVWMVAEFGNPRSLSPGQRNKWHEREGLIRHFLICHFPDRDGRYFDPTLPNSQP